MKKSKLLWLVYVITDKGDITVKTFKDWKKGRAYMIAHGGNYMRISRGTI